MKDIIYFGFAYFLVQSLAVESYKDLFERNIAPIVPTKGCVGFGSVNKVRIQSSIDVIVNEGIHLS